MNDPYFIRINLKSGDLFRVEEPDQHLYFYAPREIDGESAVMLCPSLEVGQCIMFVKQTRRIEYHFLIENEVWMIAGWNLESFIYDGKLRKV